MLPWFGNSIIELLFWLGLLVVLLLVGIFAIGKIRSKTVQQEPLSLEIMSKFREAHSRGDLNDEEFRTIKSTVTQRFQSEVSDDGETG